MAEETPDIVLTFPPEEQKEQLEGKFRQRAKEQALDKLDLVEDEEGKVSPHPRTIETPEQPLVQQFPEGSTGLQNVRETIKQKTGATEQTHDLKAFIESGEPLEFSRERGHLIIPEKFQKDPTQIELEEPKRFIDSTTQRTVEGQVQRQQIQKAIEGLVEQPETIEDFIADVEALRVHEEDTRKKLMALKSRQVEPVKTPQTEPTRSQELGEAIVDVTIGIPRKVASKVSEFVVAAGDDFRSIKLDANIPGGGTVTVQEILDSFGLGGKIKVPKPQELQFAEGQAGRKFIVDMGAFLAMMAILKQAGAGTFPAGAGAEFLTVDADQNFSNMFNQLAPELRNPITDFLEAKIDDSELEKRLKMLAESGALSMTVELALAFARRLKQGGFEVLRNEEGAIQFGPGPRKITGKKVFPEKPFTDEFGNPVEPKQHNITFKGRQFDLGRFSINWDFIKKPEDVKVAISNFRKLHKEKILDGLPEPRTLESQAKDALDRLEQSVDDEFSKFLARDAKEGLIDVDLVIAKWLRGESAAHLDFLADQVIDGQPWAYKAFLEHDLLHTEVEQIHQRMQAMSSQILNANKVILDFELGQGKQMFADQIADRYREGGRITFREGEDLQAIAEEQALKLKSYESITQLETRAKVLSKPGFNDMLEEAYVSGLLSSLKTHAVNIISNELTLFNHFGPERIFRASVGSLTQSPDRVRFGEIKAAWWGVDQTIKESWRLAKNTMATGVPSAPGVKIEGRLDKAITADNVDAMLKRIHGSKNPMRFVLSENLDKSGVLGRTFDAMGMAFSVPFRGLMGMDDFFKTMAYRMEINAQAYRQAVNQGFTGKKLAEEINRLKTELPSNIRIQAEATARYLTFTQDLGPKGQSIQNAIKTIGMPARYFIPFIRTPGNIFKYNFERTPGLNLMVKESREALLGKLGTEARDTAYARLMMGAATAATVIKLADMGVITGSAESFDARTFGGRRALRQTDYLAGWRPNSFRIAVPDFAKGTDLGNSEFYINYDRGGDAFGILMGLAVDYAKFSTTLPEDKTHQAFTALTLAFVRQGLNPTWMGNLRQTLDKLFYFQDTDDLASLSRSVMPRIISNMKTEVDPALRETRGFFDEMIAQTPFFSENLEMKLNRWGDMIPADPSFGPDFISPFTVSPVVDDEVDIEMAQQRIGLPEIPRVFERDGVRIELTPKQMNRWKILAGKEITDRNGNNLKESVRNLINSSRYKQATDGPGGGKELLVQDLYRSFRDTAKEMLLQEDEELNAAWRKKRREKEEKLRGPQGSGSSFDFGIQLGR